MMAKKTIWIGALLLLIAVMSATLIEGQVPPDDPCDPPPSNNCEWYEDFSYYASGDNCRRRCTWNWNKALAGDTCSIREKAGQHWSSFPGSVTSLSDTKVGCLIDFFSTSQLLQLNPQRLADHIHEISDLVLFADSPSLSQRLNDALILRFGFKDDFQFTIGEDIEGSISMQENGVLDHNGQHVILGSLTELDGIVLLQWENEITEDITYGFRFILNDIPIDVSGDFMHMRAENNQLIIRNNIVINFLDGSGSVDFNDGKITFDGVYITLEDHEFYGTGKFSVDIYDAGGGVHRARLDETVPIRITTEESWVCIDDKDKCARSSEGADRTIMCLDCPDTTLNQLHTMVENGGVDGFVFWTEELNHLGESTPAASARGEIITNFARGGPLVDGQDSDIQFDFHSLGEMGDDNTPLNDLEFTYLGEDEPEGTLGTIQNGRNTLELTAEYDGSRYDGIHVYGSSYRMEPVVVTTFRTFSTHTEWDGVEGRLLMDKLLDEFYEGGMLFSDDMRQHHLSRGTTFTVQLPYELCDLSSEDGCHSIEISAEEYYALYDHWNSEDPSFVEPTTLIHQDTFRYDPNTGENIAVENLYYSDGWDMTLEQRAIDRSGIFDMYLNVKFQERAWQEITEACSQCTRDTALLDDRCGSCDNREGQELLVHNRLEFLRSEVFMEQQIHEVHGLLEYLENPEHAGLIDNIFQAPVRRLFFGCGNILSHDDATECLYEQLQEQEYTLDALNEIDQLQEEGMSLSEIKARYETDPSIQSALEIPSMRLRLSVEMFGEAITAGDPVVYIYGQPYDISTPENQITAYMLLQAQAASEFSEQGFYSQALEYNKQLLDFAGVPQDEMTILLQSLSETREYDPSDEYDIIGVGEGKIILNGNEYVVPQELTTLVEEGVFDETILEKMIVDSMSARQEEFIINTQEFITELVPDTPFELALNLIPELYILGKTGIITKTATGLINWGKTAANAALLAIKLPAMSYLGMGGGWGFVDEAGELVLKYGDEVWDISRRGELLGNALDLHLGGELTNVNRIVSRRVPLGWHDIPLTDDMLRYIDEGSAVLRYPDGTLAVISPSMVGDWEEYMRLMGVHGEISNHVLVLPKQFDGQQAVIALGVENPEVMLSFQDTMSGHLTDALFDMDGKRKGMILGGADESLEAIIQERGGSLRSALSEESYGMVIEQATLAGRGDDPLGWLSDTLRSDTPGASISYCGAKKCVMMGENAINPNPNFRPGHGHPNQGGIIVTYASDPDLSFQDNWWSKFGDSSTSTNMQFIYNDAGITVVKEMDDGTFVSYLVELTDTSGMNIVTNANDLIP